MSSLTHFSNQINPAVIWLLVCGGGSIIATIVFLILCRVGARISDVPVDGESL